MGRLLRGLSFSAGAGVAATPGDDVLDESRKFEIGQIGSHGGVSNSAHLAGSHRPWIWRAAYAMVRGIC
jgi:hypothetical protein